MTTLGGASGYGSIFEINTDGSGYQLLHSFGGGASDGASPFGSFAFSGSTLYGMTSKGGANNNGTIFAWKVPLWQDAAYGGNGWYYLGWLHWFYPDPCGWIYQPQLGWLYPQATSTDSIYFFDPAMNSWIWTSNTLFPYIYRVSDNAWRWYDEWTSNPRHFYNFAKGQWETL